MKFSKKIILVVAIVAMAFVLALSAFAVTSAFSEDTFDHNEVYYGAQVSTTGNVNLKFFYTDLGSAEAMVVEVIDPNGNEIESYEYAKDEIAIKSDKYCITVPLAPSQMTCTVKVYAKSSAGVGEAIEYSVRQYAEDVLANKNLASYHNSMRALLNWGAMAQKVFDNAETDLANEGLYSLNTNPINAVSSISFTDGSVTNSDNIKGDKMSLSISPDDIVFHFYVNYTGEGELSASVSKNGSAEVKTSVEALENGSYRVSITNVGVAVFDKSYTVKISDETETFTATKSVLEYLSALSTDTKYGDIAKSMYQLYAVTMNKINPSTCQHQFAHRLTADADTSYAQCSLCFEVMGNAVSNKIDKYMPAEQLSDRRSMNGTLTVSYGTDNDGTAYARISAIDASVNGWVAWNPIIENGANTYLSGRYLVMKIRVNDNGLGQTYHKLYVSSQRPSLMNETQGLTFKATEDAQWHVSVIDLAARVGNSSGTDFVDNGDGTYTIKYLSLRPFNEHQKTEGVENATMDIAYIALCDDLGDISSLVSESTYEWSTGITACDMRYTSTNHCVTHSGEKVDESATAIIYSCTACAAELARESYPESTNKYLGSNYINNRPTGGTYKITSSGRLNENGTLYYRFNGQNQTGQIFWTRMGYDGSGNQWADHQLKPFNVGEAKYVVVKMRGNNDISSVRFNVGTIVGEVSYDNFDNMKVGGVNIPQNALNGTDWTYFVVDVAKAMPGVWNANADGTYNVCYLQFTFNGETFTTDTYFDISYIAFVDDWSEVSELTGQNTVDFIYKSGLNAKINTASGECAGNHVVQETVTGNVYKYTCLACDKILAEKTVSTDVNWYASISGITNWSTNCIKSLGYDPAANIAYASYTVTGATHINITGGTGSGAATADSYSTGRYFVMMYRGTMPGNSMRMKISSTGTVPETYNGGARLGTKLPSGWTIEVLDLSLMTDYTCDSTGRIYIMFNPQSAGQIDIAYAAIVDNFDEVASLVGEGNKYVYCGTSFENTGTVCTTGYDPSDYRLDAVEIEIAQKSNRAVNIGSVELRNDGAFDYVRTKSLANGIEPYWPASYQFATGTSGKYLIFKYRTNVKTGWLELYSSTQTYSAVGDDITWTTLNGDEKWHVFIVDMEKTVQKGDTFVADENGNFSAGYIRFDLFYSSLTSADVYFDMAYVDWAETESEAYKIAEGEDIKFGYYNGSKWIDVAHRNDAYDLTATEIQAAANTNGYALGSVELKDDAGFDYVRIYNNSTATSNAHWVYSYADANVSGASGQYLIFKYRTNVTSGWMQFATSSSALSGTYFSSTAQRSWYAPKKDTEWHTVIIDLGQSKCDDGKVHFTENGTNNLKAQFIGFRPFYGTNSASAYMDFAYVKWAATVEEAATLVAGEPNVDFGYYTGTWNTLTLPQ